MAIITGAWESTKIVCGNHKETDETPEMFLTSSGRTFSFCCPKCNPLNLTDDEKACKNQLSSYDYEKVIEFISEKIVNAEANGEQINLCNFRWKRKTQEFKVIKHDNEEIIIEFIDKKLVTK